MFDKSSKKPASALKFYHHIAEIQHVPLPSESLFLQPEYLAAIESATPAGMELRFVTLEKKGKTSLLYLFQVINLSSGAIGQIIHFQPYSSIMKTISGLLQNILFGTNPDKPNYLLICGNMCLSGDYGMHVSPTHLEESKHHLFDAIDLCTAELNKSGKVVATIIKDFRTDADPYLPVIKPHRFHKLVMDPIMQMAIRPNWASMDNYLADLSAKYRQRYNQARKKLEECEVRRLSLKEMKTLRSSIDELYTAVQEKSPVRLVRQNASYLISLVEKLGDKVQFLGIFHEGKLIGFLTGILDGKTFEAHHIGIDYHYNRSHAIYLNILYLYIRLAIEGKAEMISFGRTALEMKTTVGAVPVPHNAYIKLSNGMLNSLVKHLLPEKTSDDWIPRNPFRE